jgi:hypothetical protein
MILGSQLVIKIITFRPLLPEFFSHGSISLSGLCFMKQLTVLLINYSANMTSERPAPLAVPGKVSVDRLPFFFPKVKLSNLNLA